MFIKRTENNWLAKWWLGVDKTVLFSVLALVLFGVVIQFAASPYQARRSGYNEYHFIRNMCIYIFPSIMLMIYISSFSLQKIRKWTLRVFPILCFSLLITLFFAKTKGASRWIDFKIFKLQPSEFLKPVFAIIVAMILVRIKDFQKEVKDMNKKNEVPKKRNGVLVFIFRCIAFVCKASDKIIAFILRRPKEKIELSKIEDLKKRKKRYIILLLGILGMVSFLLLCQPDFGMTLTFICIFFSEIFVAGLPWIIIFILISLGVGGIGLAYKFIPHVTRRIDMFLTDDNYQLHKALDAIKESNFLFGGHSNNLKTIVPDIHTDFIFAAVIEEFGPVLSILLIVMFLVLIIHILYRLKIKDDLFVIFAGVGIISYITFQILYNLFSTLGIGPTKGMTLPFISYGGSSFLSSCIAIGIILSLLQDQNLRR